MDAFDEVDRYWVKPMTRFFTQANQGREDAKRRTLGAPVINLKPRPVWVDVWAGNFETDKAWRYR